MTNPVAVTAPTTHNTATTKSVEAGGVDFAYRHFGLQTGMSLLMLQDAQYDAIVNWGIPDYAALHRLTGIQSPPLIIQGDTDLMIPTKLSHLLAGLIPDAEIRIYPDAAQGFLFQYPAEVATHVNAFLATDDGRAAQ